MVVGGIIENIIHIINLYLKISINFFTRGKIEINMKKLNLSMEIKQRFSATAPTFALVKVKKSTTRGQKFVKFIPPPLVFDNWSASGF